jgi:urea transport system permease protein
VISGGIHIPPMHFRNDTNTFPPKLSAGFSPTPCGAKNLMTRSHSRLAFKFQPRLVFLILVAAFSLAQSGTEEIASKIESQTGKMPTDTSIPGLSLPTENAVLDPLVLLDTLAHSDTGKSEALRALIALTDTSFANLFRNLFQGNVYLWQPDTGQRAHMVITGVENEINGETRFPLFQVWPFTTLLDHQNKPIWVLQDSLTEFEVDRSMRILLQPVLTSLDLVHPDMQKRRNAAMTLGETGDTLFIRSLIKAAATEKDGSTKHLMLEAASRLGLHLSASKSQMAAAGALAAMHGTNALPEIKVLAAAKPPEHANENWHKAMVDAQQSLDSWVHIANSVQAIFTGVSLGSILILMALGLAIIFGLMGVINMAHGEFMMLGAYATYVTQALFLRHLPGWSEWFLAASFPIAFAVAGGIGMLVEWVLIRRLYGRPLETLLATWGLSLVLVQGARHIFGDLTAVIMPAWLGGGLEVMPQVTFPFNRLFIMVLTLVVVAIISTLFYGTRVGLKIRAVTQNRNMSRCLGVNTRRVDMLTFGLGTGIAGLAGCAITLIGNVDPGMGQNYIVDSFLVVVTGGVGKLAGTVLAGFSIGALNKFIEPALQAVYAKVALLALVILFLQVRPSGLFPAKGRNEDN